LNPGLSLIDLHKSFGEKKAVAGVTLEIPGGEILAILGPSGSGKSTVLGLVAGLLEPDAGEVRWEGESLLGVPPHARGFGLMFQDFVLFPHMSVFDNVAFGLRMRRKKAEEARAPRLTEEQIRERVVEMLALVGLPGFEKRDVNTLSGGEQQRVALARSLAPRPRLLMLDEPLGSLDRNLRERLVADLKAILQGMGQTAIYVTHDQEEAFILADRVAVMNAGRLEGVDTPQGLYAHPPSAFIARFLGLTNLLPGQAQQVNGRTVVETPVGRFPAAGQAQGPVTVLLRPDSARSAGLVLDGAEDGASRDGAARDGATEEGISLSGRLVLKEFRGSTCRVVVEINGTRLTFDFLSTVELPGQGDQVEITLDPGNGVQILEASRA
jgi:ABC-type Fe3+/spermidine/putrescine transport system ATPase subunit